MMRIPRGVRGTPAGTIGSRLDFWFEEMDNGCEGVRGAIMGSQASKTFSNVILR